MTKNAEKSINHYTDCLSIIVCELPSSQCYLGGCENCPGMEKLKDILINIFDENEIENITYKYWISKPRTTLETFIKSSYDFVEQFCDDMKTLLPHSYIATEQAKFAKSLKASLKTDEFLIICDFAENYAFVVQNAASGFHWNNNSATVFPVVIYFKINNELNHRSLVIISDCNNHDAVAVHVFNKIITDFVKTISESVSKIYYFSDGAPQQFKNFKNFVNLYYHNSDFGIPAEWHFFATAHGKGPCDGIGGTIKRAAARASLQLAVDQQITTPYELYTWASATNNLRNITIKFSSEQDYNEAVKDLSERFSKTKTITGTQQLHSVIPDTDGCLTVRNFSNSLEYKVCKLFKRQRKNK